MTSFSDNGILVVGAGPTGLSAALFLQGRGLPVRIVDKNAGPSSTSRAQVVNPRSLELVETTGVTAAIVAESHPIRGVRWYEDWQPLAEIDFETLESAFHMRVIPQARTEALLTDAVAQRGIEVERDIELSGFTDRGATVSAQLNKDGNPSSFEAALLLAADGAHSLVREKLGIDFRGHNFPEAWPLYDIELDDPLLSDWARVSFVDNGLIFVFVFVPVSGECSATLVDMLAGDRGPRCINYYSVEVERLDAIDGYKFKIDPERLIYSLQRKHNGTPPDLHLQLVQDLPEQWPARPAYSARRAAALGSQAIDWAELTAAGVVSQLDAFEAAQESRSARRH